MTTENHIVITDDDGQRWPNLAGVFDRVFPIVVGQVLRDGKSQRVRYHGDSFSISRVCRASRDQLASDPRLISRCDIRQGDDVERWMPLMIPSGNFPPFVPHPNGTMELFTTAMAESNTLDGVGRWTDAAGDLVHGEHGDHTPPSAAGEILLRSN